MLKQTFGAIAAALAVSAAQAALAEVSPYCQRVEARAASDAALLMWPRLMLQGIRFPGDARLDSGTTVGNGYQARAALTFSPVDYYRGLRITQVGFAECHQHEARKPIEELLVRAQDSARLRALREQAAFLAGKQEVWRGLLARADERVAARVVTLVEHSELHRHAVALEQKMVFAEGSAAELAAAGVVDLSVDLEALLGAYRRDALQVELDLSSVRKLEAWDVRLTGGIIPQDAPPDWYGLVELSFNLGAFQRHRLEARQVAARDQELRQARHELDARVGDLRRETRAARERARRELEVAERQAALLASTRRALESASSPGVAHARDILTIEDLALDSERVFLRAYVAALRPIAEEHRDR